MKRLAFWFLISAVALLAIAPAVVAQQEPVEVQVSIQDGYFDPADITVAPGTWVTWTNEGDQPHTVTADNGLFDSGLLYPGESYSVWFDGAGTTTYHCSPNMTGSVTVA